MHEPRATIIVVWPLFAPRGENGHLFNFPSVHLRGYLNSQTDQSDCMKPNGEKILVNFLLVLVQADFVGAFLEQL